MASTGKRKGTAKPTLIAVLALGLLLVALPTATVLFVGMTPTLVAFIVDTTPGRYLTRCVAGMNVAGVAPYLHILWTKDHTMRLALDIVTDVFAWFAMYGASALGWLLFLGLPGIVSMVRTLNARRRVYMLREKQKRLINEWGDSILPVTETRTAEAGESGAAAAEAAPADGLGKSAGAGR